MWILCLTFGLLASALPAWAAEIVEVRVGRHPAFTRVVFELDRAAGYRIERSDPSADVVELIVSLEAASIPHNIKSGKLLIEQVDVEPLGSRSVARVRLAKEGLRLKEMILTKPPRIVLDVLKDPGKTPFVAQESPPEPSQAPGDEAFDEIVAKIPIDPAPPIVVQKEPVVEKASLAEPAVVAEVVREEAETFSEDDLRTVADEPSTSTPIEEPEAAPEVAQLAAEPVPVRPAPVAQPTPRPMVAKTSAPRDEGGGWMTWALVGGGVVLLLLGGGFVMRRGGASGDAGEYAEGDDAFGSNANEQTGVDENPFSGFTNQEAAGSPSDASDDLATQPMMNEEGATSASSPQGLEADEEKESESVIFDDSEETVMDEMEVISREQVNESLGGSMPPAMGAAVAVPEEFQQMVAEMGRRMEALESRCDELVDARDRLERQVAAQTEELRVQRAAIARTQRAVRNLGRPEGEDQEATEPALRDPNRTSSD
ncbi:MAG: hypothetical protein CL933_06235 [Deltaproteobacteria bacterium]|nr:hypothetical protein [Deltaproteobacteria bacterium]